MPTRRNGSPNPWDARCPLCGEVLVVARHKRSGACEWACPRALVAPEPAGSAHNRRWQEWEVRPIDEHP